MNDKGNITDRKPPLLLVVIGTGLGSGFWPWGPGTAGSVFATAVWAGMACAISTSTVLSTVTLVLVVLSTVVGTWAVRRLQPYWGEDPSRVVIDEMAGVWIPLALLSPFSEAGTDAWWWMLVALVLFRFFDMVKPLGIKALDRKKGAFYVMADDLLGGVYAAIVLLVIKNVCLWVE